MVVNIKMKAILLSILVVTLVKAQSTTTRTPRYTTTTTTPYTTPTTTTPYTTPTTTTPYTTPTTTTPPHTTTITTPPTTPTATTINPTTRTTPTRTTTENSADPRCVNSNTTYWPHPSDCHLYIECFEGNSYTMTCPPHMYFSDRKKKCAYADESECCQRLQCD